MANSTSSSSKMTEFDFLTAVEKGEITPEVIAHATAGKAKILAERAKAAEKRKEKAKENDPLKAQIVDFLRACPNVSSEIGKAVGISTSKASYLCREMVEDGVLSVSEVKSPTTKSKVKQYTLVIKTEEVTEDEPTEDGEDTAE